MAKNKPTESDPAGADEAAAAAEAQRKADEAAAAAEAQRQADEAAAAAEAQRKADEAAAAAEAQRQADEAAAAAARKVPVRVLTQCAYGDANDVIELTPVEARTAELQGVVDSSPAAVAYARSLQA